MALCQAANQINYEDEYIFNLECIPKEEVWKLRVYHKYFGKTSAHPTSLFFSEIITEETAEEVVKNAQNTLIKRVESLIGFKEAECEKLKKNLSLAITQHEELTKAFEAIKVSVE